MYSACLHESLEDWHVQHSAAALKRGDGGDGGGTPPAPLSRDGVVCGVVQPLGAERALEYQGGGGGGERGSAHRVRQVRQGLGLAARRGRVSQGGYGLGAPCARPEHGAAAARAAAARRRLHDRGSSGFGFGFGLAPARLRPRSRALPQATPRPPIAPSLATSHREMTPVVIHCERASAASAASAARRPRWPSAWLGPVVRVRVMVGLRLRAGLGSGSVVRVLGLGLGSGWASLAERLAS
eukprot:scaffold62843_cov62-Phaeocystis_antarctica.AAC.2